MAKYFVEDTSLTAVADAIRTKGGTSEALEFPDGFVSAVEGIQAGGGGDDEFLLSIVERTITELDTDKFTVIGNGAFCRSSLIKVRLPKAKTIGYQSFYESTSLKTIELPEVTLLGADCFRNCYAVESIIVPKAEEAKNGVFQNNRGVVFIDFPKLRMFSGGQSLNGCRNLKVLIFRIDGVCSLKSTDVLGGTLFASGKTGGVLLIPSAHVESYKTATNWSAFYGYGTNHFLALEDYTVDGTIMGEIDWDKVNALFEGGTA